MSLDVKKELEGMVGEARQTVTFDQIWRKYTKEERISTQTIRRSFKGAIATVAGVASVFGATLGLSAISPTVALAMDKIPVVNQVYDWFGDPGLNQATVFENKVHISSTDRGITFTVNDVYDDQGRLALLYKIKSFNGTLLGNSAVGPIMGFYTNGQPLNVTSVGYTGNVSSQEWNGINEIFPGDTNVKLPEQFDLQIVMHQIGNTHGYWEVQVPVSGVKELQDTRILTPHVSKVDNGITLSIDQVIVTPATLVVNYHYTIERGKNTIIHLDGSSDGQLFFPKTDAATMYKTFDGSAETIYGSSLFPKPKELGQNIELLPENDPSPAPGTTTSPSIKLSGLDMNISLH